MDEVERCFDIHDDGDVMDMKVVSTVGTGAHPKAGGMACALDDG